MTRRLLSVLKHLSLTSLTMPAPNVLTADVFETGIIQTPRAIKQVKVK